jgi:hypothetical protein
VCGVILMRRMVRLDIVAKEDNLSGYEYGRRENFEGEVYGQSSKLYRLGLGK